ncbi:MAG: hypothetical protein JOY66_17660, partial [Acetobacteraceae bacterium]|nr:hypothetical protein [Acetobacteraceae bacterium]
MMQSVVSVTTTSGQSGVGALGGQQMSFIGSSDVVTLAAGSGQSMADMGLGGTLLLNGGRATVTGAGNLSVVEAATGQGHNAFAL